MLKKAMLVLALVFAAGMFFAWSSPSLLLAQEDEIYEDEFYYDDTSFEEDFYEDFEPILYEDDLLYEDEYDYTDVGDLWALIWANMILSCCIGIPIYLFMALALFTIGKKVGEDNAWMAWVPILNFYYMVKLGDMSGWLFLLLFVPVVNFFFAIYVWMQIFKRRGFNEWLALLLLIPVVNFIMVAYVAWGEGSSSSEAAQESKEVTAEKKEE